ncbi:MAG: hypothetical protein B7Y99_09150 [Caulobacterales bacterium 32-69-10]|nr:MAG: hypothetical protein B7Y99_09150 [Caulobacterales bacterium 32-69-10]
MAAPNEGADRAADAHNPIGGLTDEVQHLAEQAREALPELRTRAEKAFRDNADKLRTQSKEAAQAAGEQLDTARMYVVDRVQERPFTTTLAVLGAGFLIGLLFAGRRR